MMKAETVSLIHVGWYEKKSGDPIVVYYETATGEVNYRYKGARTRYTVSGESFRKRFANYNNQP